ncbi:MAG: hypothetical protein RLZZ366_394 [Pseudomonadota bacterium]|jgi:Protein of unknown function (DUF2842)
MDNNPTPPTWRKPFGMMLILTLITVWAGIIVTYSAEIGQLPVIAQIGVFLVTGIIWISPLKPLLLWMDQGKWRE